MNLYRYFNEQSVVCFFKCVYRSVRFFPARLSSKIQSEVLRMKHCPACNFTFPDSHRVCDFDGTELVPSPERQSLMRVPKHVPHLRLGLKKPMLLTSLAVLGLFLSAVFIGYLESPAPTIPALVKDYEVPNLSRGLTPAARTTEQLANVKKTAGHSKRTSSRSVKVAVSSTARLRQKSVTDNGPRNDVIARTRDSKRTSSEKSPKIVAVLKTTWRVLKKPFDF
jgi:hypothetical protein